MKRDMISMNADPNLRLWSAGLFLLLLLLLPVSGAQASGVDSLLIISPISAKGDHTCRLKTDGTVDCWGAGKTDTGEWPEYGQSTPPEGTFTQVSAGDVHTCGLKTDDTVDCWGAGKTDTGVFPEYGQSIPPSKAFTQLSAGTFHTCGVKKDKRVACWGNNDFGQSTAPAGTFTEVSAGHMQTCGVKTDGTVACWGDNSFGQSTAPTGTFTQVSAGDYWTCGVKTDGTVACWGAGKTDTGVFPEYGQSIPPSGTFTQVSGGYLHTCGVKTGGAVACWGWNDDGQSTPPSGAFTQVSAAYLHTCGLKTDGTAACWGANDYGQAPVVSVSPSTLPIGTAGSPYSQTLTATGGLAPYTFKVISGSLPGGFTLSEGGLLKGIPASSGIYTFTVQAVDAHIISGSQEYTLTISTNTPPTLGTLTPSVLSSTAGVAKTFKAVYRDANGYKNLKQVNFKINATSGGANCIYAVYNRPLNKLYLYNDAGTAYVGNCTPGAAKTLTNTKGVLKCAATTVTVSGNNLTVSWNIKPNSAFASATKKNLYMFARDMSNATTGWKDKGDWTINP